jgi:hypothetical protein
MDVHPPHHPIRNWKDFLLHLLTITIGLLIALTLEAAVEAAHHRHLVRDARENIRHEIQANLQLYQKNEQSLQQNREVLARTIEQLRELRNGKKLQSPDLHWRWSWNSFREAAWKSARDIGAIGYMNLSTIEGYDLVYSQQSYVNDDATKLVLDEDKIGSPLRITQDYNALLPSEVQSMLLGTAELDSRIETLQRLMKSLQANYESALKTL